MNLIIEHLPTLLIVAAIGQIAVSLLNLGLDKLLNWKTDLETLPLLLQEVFTIHKWFITITLMIFGIITIRFPDEMGTGAHGMARWLAGGIGMFWAIRTVIQWAYYSHSHWKGKPKETLIHWILTLAYGGCAFVYLLAAFIDRKQ